MKYPKPADLKELTQQIELYAQLKAEYGANGISEILSPGKQEKLQDVRQSRKSRPTR